MFNYFPSFLMEKKDKLLIIFNNILYFTLEYSNFIIAIFFLVKKKDWISYMCTIINYYILINLSHVLYFHLHLDLDRYNLCTWDGRSRSSANRHIRFRYDVENLGLQKHDLVRVRTLMNVCAPFYERNVCITWKGWSRYEQWISKNQCDLYNIILRYLRKIQKLKFKC